MIDWWQVFFGALWVLGLSLILAAFSLADYRRSTLKTTWREQMAAREFQIATNAGLMLTCAGFAGQAAEVWQIIIWSALGVAFAYYAFSAFRLHR